ncbi:MAG: alkene reductase [Cyanobium sp.]|uniref:alkene reductase n=1 Tax=Synechococcus sp. CS-1333 TaxID=2848638 RepID=UPI000DBC1A04|nr:alkene reductase [Synechococcus sp. CS-1333]MCT0210733.1 alkene reductase [Synechococcus sp. CS-1333]PZV22865.1 MAG: alkene reductase [Cyanobium sp.]
MTIDLFTPLAVGPLELPNRVLMAPLTRSRAEEGHIPGPLMAEYYSQRASAGLIIAEATMAMEGHSAFIREPGIHSAAQVEGWTRTTEAVHARGGRIVLQIWHGGRACHPLLNNGLQPVAPSAIAISGDQIHTPQGKVDYVVPRALADDELPAIVAGFRLAARHAIAAGFDGVEVHGANGYLLDEFLRDGSNQRSGPYGGPIENRARLLLEVIEAVRAETELVGLRLSPLNSYNAMRDSDPVALASWLADHLNRTGLAYLHLMRGDFLQQQLGDVLTPVRERFQGVLIANMGYTAAEANAAIAAGAIDAVAFGTAFLANPDLPERLRSGAPLNTPDPATFYSPGPAGYTDYPFLSAAA